MILKKMQTSEGQLGTEKIPKLIIKLAIPMVVAQLVNALYNMVDRIYIGHIQGVGNLALTGVGLIFPIILIISAFSSFIGLGGAPLAAIQLGKNDKEKAEKILSNCFLVLIVFSVVLTILFMVFKQLLLYLFGASENTYPYADEYLTIYLLGTIFVLISLGLNMFISSQGNAKTAMLSVIIGAVINITLDPVFIFLLNMGVKGAAIATVISQAASAIWILRFLTSEKSAIRIKLKYMKPDFKIIGSFMALGVSPFIMQVMDSAIVVVLNSGLKTYGGDLHVGAMTILQSIMQFATIPINGFGQGIKPILSYNYGAAKFDRVKKAFKISITIIVISTSVCCFATLFFPTPFVRLFTSDENLIALSSKMLPIFMAGLGVLGIQFGCQNAFLALGQAKISLFIAMLRKAVLMIPLSITLPKFFGVNGIYFAEPISDTISATTCGIIFLCIYKKILTVETLEKL